MNKVVTNMLKILAIVPAYNEEANIVNVINDLSNLELNLDIVVINDGSKDKTGLFAESTKKALVVNLPCNLGIGGAVQTGFIYAYRNNYDIAVQFDGDGQHQAVEIFKLIEPLNTSRADVVIGSRFCKKHHGFRSTITRRIGIKLFEFINSFLINQRITDNTSGFRAYNKRAVNFLADYYPTDYPEPEAVILLGRNGFKIVEVFSQMQERQAGMSSISGLKSFYYMIKVLLAIFMTFLRPKIIKEKL